MGFEELNSLEPGECVVFVRHKGQVIGMQGIATLWNYTESVDFIQYGDPAHPDYFPTDRRRNLKLDMLVQRIVVTSVNWDDIYQDEPAVLPLPRLTEGDT